MIDSNCAKFEYLKRLPTKSVYSVSSLQSQCWQPGFTSLPYCDVLSTKCRHCPLCQNVSNCFFNFFSTVFFQPRGGRTKLEFKVSKFDRNHLCKKDFGVNFGNVSECVNLAKVADNA